MSEINGEYVKPKEIAKIVRTALRERFGAKHVSVTCESGTAYGWIDAKVEVKRPRDCYCKPMQPYCGRCSETLQRIAPQARTLVLGAMANANAKFSTHYGDMDNEPRDDFILSVQFISESTNSMT